MANEGSSILNSSDSVDSLLNRLPKERFWESEDMYNWEGVWLTREYLEAALAFKSHFEACDDDIILASTIKTGTTWLKALCLCILQCQNGGADKEEEDILVKYNPHTCVPTLDALTYTMNSNPDFSGMPSPRLFHTHMQYNVLPDSIKNSKCKIIYITRNPKDTLVSIWHFYNTMFRPNEEPFPLEKAFECFYNGVAPYGSFFDHVLQYWSQSLKMPHKILFLKYEELKKDPKAQVKRLASFLGRPFGNEEEVDKVLWRCSLERLKNLEVNKNGLSPWTTVPNSIFFRVGVVGGWKNHLTPEMEERLDQIFRFKAFTYLSGLSPSMADKVSPIPNNGNSAEALLNELPRVRFWDAMDICQWEGFWFEPGLVKSAITFQSCFEAHDDDVVLASTMKTGTTWLKALCLCILKTHCSDGVEEEEVDILVKDNPQVHVQTIEAMVYATKPHSDLYTMPPPRLFHSHLPYNVLPDSIKNSNCKIVYIARNPKDTFVSLWHFFNAIFRHNQDPFPLEEALDCFCNGVHQYGPFFDHVLQYWMESLKRPHKILFLKFEDLKRDPKGQVKRLASFLGRPFRSEEEVDEVLWRCSLERLKNLEVNKNGLSSLTGVPNSSYFRLGIVGDSKNYLTPEMEERLDEITRMKLGSSGLDFMYEV
ncbi:hypothetical protein F0562_031426 [Nyssa sinensis]|uniref:Sulfotransferase domain-containing protein n=1 Tax=Nyssa sinensis TaxID=561372 RepID=A0A5J5AU47_9ASTE|nr:hypothetical protein F0562_031426 [Nyssa sinensis]